MRAGVFRLGCDFGTANTVAMLGAPDGTVRPLLFDGSPLLPSAVYVDRGEVLVGVDAIQAGRARPDRFEPYPKRVVDEGTVLLGDAEVPVVRLLGAVLRRVLDEAERVAGGTVPDVVLTHPAGWGEPRRRVLRDAAALAGVAAADLVPEPVAAAMSFARPAGGRVAVVYDLGAGTFDASVVRPALGGFEVLATDGCDDVGGLDVDAALVDHVGTVCARRSPDLWRRLSDPDTTGDRRARQQLWRDVRAAKETLSRTASALVPVPLFDDDVLVTRADLERLARPLLDRTVAAVRRAVDASGRPAEAIFLVGGGSRMPLAATLLHRAFGLAPTAVEQPEFVVAAGALGTPIDPESGTRLDPSPRSGVASEWTPTAGTLGVELAASLVAEPAAALADEATIEHPATSTLDPAPDEPVAEPVAEPTTEPVAEPTTEPVAELEAAEPSGEPGGGPLAVLPVEPVVEPAAGSARSGSGPSTPALPPTAGRRRRVVAAVVACVAAVAAVPVVLDLWPRPAHVGAALARPVGSPSSSASASRPGPAATIRPNGAGVYAVAFDPTGNVLATGGDDPTIQLWDAHDRHPLGTLAGHTKTVYHLTFSADGRWLASSGADSTIRIWNVAGRSQATTIDQGGTSSDIGFDPAGHLFAATVGSDQIQLWDGDRFTRSGPLLNVYPDYARTFAFNGAGTILATCDFLAPQQGIFLWDVATRKKIGHLDQPIGVEGEMTAAGNILAIQNDRTISVWDLASRAKTGPDIASSGPFALSPDGSMLATGIRIFNTRTGQLLTPDTPGTNGPTVLAVTFSRDGKTLVTGGGLVRYWDVATLLRP